MQPSSDPSSPPDLQPQEALLAAVEAFRASAPLQDELLALYGELEQEEAILAARCMGGGCCCKFDLAGHRLYVSTAELALLLARCPLPSPQVRPLRCPYQQGPRCMARQFRPLGCRTYFCQGASDRMQRIYEVFHGRVKFFHNAYGLSYVYGELTQWLAKHANETT